MLVFVLSWYYKCVILLNFFLLYLKVSILYGGAVGKNHSMRMDFDILY